MTKNKKLKRTLSFPVVALYGLGNILGAGIYVLVGRVAGVAGPNTVLAFMIAMVVAALTAFSYMELSGRYPVSASVSVYLHKAFRARWLSVGVGIAMIAGGVASAAALSQGFAGYLAVFFDLPKILVSVGLLMSLGLLAMRGIGESARVAAVFTLLEITGLLLVIWAGRGALLTADYAAQFTVDPNIGLGGILAGATLAFYAFIGFEDMVNVAEEAKHPRKTMPLAILFSLIASTILYLLVVIVALAVVPVGELSTSDAPLALVLQKTGYSSIIILSVIGLVAAINGIIVQIIMGSRTLYGLAKQGWLHDGFAEVDSNTRTPIFATGVIVGLMILATILLPLISLAQLTSLLLLTIFSLVNISLVIIKLRHPKHAGFVTVSVLVPIFGFLASGALLVSQLLTS